VRHKEMTYDPPSDTPTSGEASPLPTQTAAPASIMDYFKTARMDDPHAVPTVSDEALAKFPAHTLDHRDSFFRHEPGNCLSRSLPQAGC
jgi:hypothetical protein